MHDNRESNLRAEDKHGVDPSQTAICLYARSLQATLYARIGLQLEARGYRTVYIVQNDREEAEVGSHDVSGPIYNLTRYIRENWSNRKILDALTLDQIERKYDIESVWSLFYTDRYLIQYDYDDAVRFIKLHVAFFDDIATTHKVNYLLNEGIALFSSYIFYYVARNYNCRYFGIICPRNFSMEKIFFTTDANSRNYHLDRLYEKRDFSDNQILQAREFIEDFRKSSVHPDYMKVSGRKPRLTGKALAGVLRYLFSLLKPIEKYDYEKYNGRARTHLYLIRNYLKHFVHKRYYRQPSDSERFYLFPLHFQPEASTLVWAQNYEKQLYAVDLLAKKIPGDAKLYVKEHFGTVGHRETEFYRKLKNYPNVKLIDPWQDSQVLMKKSLGVIVLTGTAGWEALLHRIPVFILGTVYFENFKYAWHIRNIDDITGAFKKAAVEFPAAEEYDRELAVYIAAYLNSLKTGNYYLRPNDENLVGPENVTNLTNHILEEIRIFHSAEG